MTQLLPIFPITQPDGVRTTIDLSAPGEMGDFAFRAHLDGVQRGQYFCAYHTGEASIFVAVLRRMSAGRAAADVLLEVDRMLHDVQVRTSGCTYTTRSENSFRAHLTKLANVAVFGGEISDDYTADSGTSRVLRVTGDVRGLQFLLHRPDMPGDGAPGSRRAPQAVTIPTDSLWRFAAGMIWRSYLNEDFRMSLSRLSSQAYDTAVDAFTEGLKAGNDTGRERPTPSSASLTGPGADGSESCGLGT